MEINSDQIKKLIERPSESLSVEIKRWIDPKTPDGVGKIVRTALALRNFNGGFIVIGFDNNTLLPDKENIPKNVKESFHIDYIQGIISKYSSETFEVAIEYAERDNQLYPVIAIPSGIKTPIASKSDLIFGDKHLINEHAVYVRSLNANNTPSTTKAIWKDWANVVEICFENREADIGRFVRRHLGGLKQSVFKNILGALSTEMETPESIEEKLIKYIDYGKERMAFSVKENGIAFPEQGHWEIGLIITGPLATYNADINFLRLLESNNPDYTGWPIWMEGRGAKGAKSYVYGGAWEELLGNLGSIFGNEIDFMIKDPNGKFYLYRLYQDDTSGSERKPKPMTSLDFGLQVIRVAEAIAVGIAFGKALGGDPEKTRLNFVFRWNRLKDRELASWANPGKYISPGRKAYQDTVTSFVDLPLDTPLTALGAFVKKVVDPLFAVFDGYVASDSIIEDLTRRLIERKL